MQKVSENFNREEFACKCGCGFNTVDIELLGILEKAREHFNSPIIITNSCRCYKHNKEVGGSRYSKHLLGQAADIVVEGVEPYKVYKYFNKTYPKTYGVGDYETFTHIDRREEKARW